MKKSTLFSICLFFIAIVANAQDLGIGVSFPQERLDVGGAVRLRTASNNLEGTIQYDASSDKYQLNIGGTWYDMRYGPAVGFFARLSSGHHTGAGYVLFNAQKHDTGGNNYNTSNGRFTAPVKGLYHFCWGGIEYPSSSVARAYLYVNGSNYFGNATQFRLDSGSDAYGEGCNCGTVYLNAGDWVAVYVSAGGLYVNYSFFTGYLVAGN